MLLVNLFQNIFRRFDSDGSGTFSGLELHRALSAVGKDFRSFITIKIFPYFDFQIMGNTRVQLFH